MQFYNKWNLIRLERSEKTPVKHSCLYDDELGVYLLISSTQEEELENEFCEGEIEVYTSEDYVRSKDRSKAISEYVKRDRYKGKPTGVYLSKNLLSSERIKQVLILKKP